MTLSDVNYSARALLAFRVEWILKDGWKTCAIQSFLILFFNCQGLCANLPILCLSSKQEDT